MADEQFRTALGALPHLDPRPTNVVSKLNFDRTIRSVLFDVYGTLLISASGDVGSADPQASTQILEKTLASFGVDAHFDENPLVELIRADHASRDPSAYPHPEVDIREIWDQLLEQLGAKLPAPDRDILAFTYECAINPVAPMPGAADLVAALLDAGIPMGVVSNAQFYTPILVRHLLPGFLEQVDESMCAWSFHHLRAKPDVTLFSGPLGTLRGRFGVDAPDVLYIGNDILNDVATAKEAGCATALFAQDARSLRLREGDTRVSGVKADITLARFYDMMALIHPGELRFPGQGVRT